MSTFEVLQSGQVDCCSLTVKKINNLLNSPKTRIDGLQLLNVFLPQCSEEDFLLFCISWMQNCFKVDDLTTNKDYSAQLLRDLVVTSSNFPELKKSVSFFITTRYFDYFFKHFVNSQAGWSCTEACLLLYRGACGPFHESLEKQLINEIEKNVNISSTVGRCLALLPSVGGAGNEGLNHKRNWKSQFSKFLNICHSILNDLFEDLEECKLQEYEILSHSHRKNGDRNIEYLATQLRNHSTILCHMLLNQYPAPKNVPADKVLQLICRGLAINPSALTKHRTSGVLSLVKALPIIHSTLLILLKAVVVSCKNQLLPYSHLICKLLKQSLQNDFPGGDEKELTRLRISTYEALSDWLVAARYGSCVEFISDVVVSSAVRDIQPEKGVVVLKEARIQYQTESKRPKPSLVNAAVVGQLCYAALKVLQFLLKFAGVLLKSEVHKVLQEVVVKLLVEVQRSSGQDLGVPFVMPACRTELYSLLLELVNQPCPEWPPPTNFALRLFSQGLDDSSPQVSSFCSAGLNSLTLIIHSQYDNGGFSLSTGPHKRGGAEEELPWREEPMTVGTEEEGESLEKESRRNEESNVTSEETDSAERVNDESKNSDISSDEDSRQTVTFPKDAEEFPKVSIGMSEGRAEGSSFLASQAEDYSNGKGGKSEGGETIFLSTEEKFSESSSVGQMTPESGEVKKLLESNHSLNTDGSKGVSPDSTCEENHRKTRYFLRSKAKGSSEEPEEASKGTSSPESTKGTPAKCFPRMTPGGCTKRRRTRAHSKAESNTELDATKTPEKRGPNEGDEEEEEAIKAAFDDSFLD